MMMTPLKNIVNNSMHIKKSKEKAKIELNMIVGNFLYLRIYLNTLFVIQNFRLFNDTDRMILTYLIFW